MAQTVKNLPAMQEIRVRSPGREDPLEKEMALHAWKLLDKKAGEHPNHFRVVSNTSSLSLCNDTSPPASIGAILSWTRACFSWRSIQCQPNQFRHTKEKPSWFLNIKEFFQYIPPTLPQSRQAETLVPLLSGRGCSVLFLAWVSWRGNHVNWILLLSLVLQWVLSCA